MAIHYHIGGAASKRSIMVRSEEAPRYANYGANGVFDLDPIDGTSDLIQGYQRQPRRSNAASALGYWDHGPVAGAVNFPLFGGDPVIYLGSKGGGVYCEYQGQRVQQRIDPGPMRGIVLISSKTMTPDVQELAERLVTLGYLPLPDHGAVFKACALLDCGLPCLYGYNEAYYSALPVVGVISRKARLHDVVATTALITEAGGVATMPQMHGDPQRWVAANNQQVYDQLMGLIIP
jgi:3'-phosphoadenosine 5'-phosphosulfate (PAPS) 3'-phosphatase